MHPDDQPVRVLIQTSSTAATSEVSSVVSSVGTVRFTFESQQLIAATVPANKIGLISQNSAVTAIDIDQVVERSSEPQLRSTGGVSANAQTAPTTPALDSWGYRRVDAGLVHAAGINGSGVTVAIVDDGIDPTSGLQGKIADERDLAPNSRFDGNDPTDLTGHGSNVAGIAAASETTVTVPTGNSDDTRRIKGVAPGASLLNAKIGTFDDTLANTPTSDLEVDNLNDGEQADIPVNVPNDGRWLRVDASWSDPANNVTVELLDENGQVITEIADANRVRNPVETTVTEPTRTRIEVNGTTTLGTAVPRQNNGFTNVTAVRVTGTNVSGSADVDIDVRNYRAGVSSLSTIAAGINWAAGNTSPQPSQTADIISLSYGGGGTNTSLNPIPDAMDDAVDNNIVFVTSAGNDAERNNLVTTTEVKSKTSIITVGAINRQGVRAEFSQGGDADNGVYKPDVVAPGTRIPSAGPTTRIPQVNGQYDGTEKSGTSQATPHVSGIAALYIQMYKRQYGESPTPQQVRAAIIAGTTEPASPTNGANSLSYSDETGLGVVNAYKTYLAFSFAGENSGETDELTVSTPQVLPPNRISPPGTQPVISGTVYRQEQGNRFEVSLNGSGAAGYGPINVSGIPASPSETYSFNITRTSGSSNNDDEYAIATHYPPISQTFESETVQGYTFRGPVALNRNESAAYAAPFGQRVGSTFIGNRGGIRAIGYYNSTQGDIDISVNVPQGPTSTSGINTTEINTEQVISEQPSGASKVVFSADNTSGTKEFAHASNYPLLPLPSEASIAADQVTAGNASNPSPVSITVSVENAGLPYTYTGFGSPNKTQFNVSVGGKQVPADRIALTELSQNEYQLRFVPPTQSSQGIYNLSVSFTDTKAGVSNTATAVNNGGVEYTQGGTTAGTASLALIIDDSGSMNGQKIYNAKRAGNETVALLNDEEFAAVVGFDSSARTDFPLSQVESNRSAMRRSIGKLEAGGGTNIGDALRVGRTELGKTPQSTTQAAILLSDGINNGRIDPVQEAQNYGNDGIPVYTIALGEGADTRQLRQIANASGGTTTTRSDSAALNDIFANIRGIVSGTSTLQSASGQVKPSQSASQQVEVDDSTDSMTIRVQTASQVGTSSSLSRSQSTTPQIPDSKFPRVRLSYPNGSVVPYNETVNGQIVVEDSDVDYSNVSGTIIYRIDDPQPGQWSYEINNTQSNSQLSYQSDVTASTSRTLDVATSGSRFVNGSNTTITATIVGPNGGISGANATAEVTFESGNTATVTLTDQGRGQYSGTVPNLETGMAQATVKVTGQNLSRQESADWRVVEQASVLQVSSTNQTTPSAAQGGTVVSEFTLSQPTPYSQSSAAKIDGLNNETANRGVSDTAADEKFLASARELANSNVNLSTVEGLDPAVIEAARVLREDGEVTGKDQQQSTSDVATISNSNQIGSGTRVVVSPQDLTGPNGTTIPESNIAVEPTVVTLPSGGSQSFQLVIDVPDDAPVGTYNGTAELLTSGTVIETSVSVNITQKDRQVIITRIQRNGKKWQDADTVGKEFYEVQIANELTDVYFGTGQPGGSTNSSGGSSSTARTTPAGVATELHTQDPSATIGPEKKDTNSVPQQEGAS
jgi:subtilisin family serine protease